jgi:hypothetical protein
MANQSPEEKQLPDARVSLIRGFKLMNGAQAAAEGDRMIVQQHTGHSDDCLIFQGNGETRAKRLEMRMVIQTSSPAVPATTGIAAGLVDLSPEDEKRLLAIYKMFSK